ncbi:uncharacterized protein LOC114527625 [Dendronephthya gigantea]|uniref:uncharacterized protein LOC114527625 n=1 Tax=Dendronephthya gigantea TaxID=151771 RepID=UPI00106B30C4|nr:uncharacterized protein LOC114527625 [Dendronephthya gigantea]
MDKTSTKKHDNFYNFKEILAAMAVGAMSFPFALGFMQSFVFKPVRVSCKLPQGMVLVCGAASVTLSGIFASSTFVLSCEGLKKSKLLANEHHAPEKRFKLEFDKKDEHIFMWGAGSLVIFNLLGGKLRQVVPSHLFHPGAFARVSVPASGKSYAKSSAKRKIYLLGRRYGCHSCGKRSHKKFIADHIPPNKLVKFYQSQVFYPQCKTCSQKQGGVLSSINGSGAIQTHATTLRTYHLWLPIPLGFAVVKKALEENDSTNNSEV